MRGADLVQVSVLALLHLGALFAGDRARLLNLQAALLGTYTF